MNRRHNAAKEVDLRAVEYVRMSTDHQKYSIANQSAAIQEYAEAHSIRILRSYIDSGKSGLTITKRDGLKNLLQTVLAGTADFNTVLVYDVSRHANRTRRGRASQTLMKRVKRLTKSNAVKKPLI
jgi:DNA invertase Pin-like site-specific DNA recombinase